MMSLTRFYQHQNIIPFIHRKKKKNTNSKQKTVGGLKSSNNPKAMAIFIFPRREEGFLACLLIYDSLDAKAQETNLFCSWV
jgi:hypothetical protein